MYSPWNLVCVWFALEFMRHEIKSDILCTRSSPATYNTRCNMTNTARVSGLKQKSVHYSFRLQTANTLNLIFPPSCIAHISLSHLSALCYLMCFLPLPLYVSPPLSPSFSVFLCALVCLLVVGRVKRLHYLDTLLMHAALWLMCRHTRAPPPPHTHTQTPSSHSHNQTIHTLTKSNILLHVVTHIHTHKELLPQFVIGCKWVQERKEERQHMFMLFLYSWEITADSTYLPLW